MWRKMRTNRVLWTVVGALALTSLSRTMNARRRARRIKRAAGIMGMLSRTGRTFANGALRLARQM